MFCSKKKIKELEEKVSNLSTSVMNLNNEIIKQNDNFKEFVKDMRQEMQQFRHNMELLINQRTACCDCDNTSVKKTVDDLSSEIQKMKDVFLEVKNTFYEKVPNGLMDDIKTRLIGDEQYLAEILSAKDDIEVIKDVLCRFFDENYDFLLDINEQIKNFEF